MTSADDANSGCFSSLLRRLLCLGDNHSMSTANDIGMSNISSSNLALDNAKTEEHAVKSSGTPSVVARLMGLDSLPSATWVSKANFPDSVPRSKSVSFVEYLLEFDLTQPHHRRIRTSMSFREVPTLLKEERHDVVVLNRNNRDVSHRKTNTQSYSSGRDKDIIELKQRKKQRSKYQECVRESDVVNKKLDNQNKNLKFSKLKTEPKRVLDNKSTKLVARDSRAKELCSVSPVSKKNTLKNGDASLGSRTSPQMRRKNEAFREPPSSRKRRNRRNAKKIVPENSNESSSPVSVLTVNDSHVHHEPHYTVAAERSFINLVEAIKNGDYGDQGSVADRCFELHEKLLNLTRKEIELTDWTGKNTLKAKIHNEVSVKLELEIFDLLVQDAVEELVMNSSETGLWRITMQ